jgi:branched-chain amino acid aminotransferase
VTAAGLGSVWVDGRLVPHDAATVSVFDHGLTVGDGIFESIRVLGGVPFALRRHLDRLHRSAKGLGLDIGVPDEVLRAAVDAVIASAPAAIGRVRVTVTGGVAPAGSGRGANGSTVIVAGGTLDPWPPTADVVVAPWPRNERSPLAGLKTTSYAENVVALAYAHERGASEAVFGNLAGNVCEGTGSNVFIARGGRLITPPLASGCLAGVTRALVLELVTSIEDDLPLDALATADEVFLTSTTRDIQPVRAVDGVVVAAAPGPLTRAATAAFTDLVAHNLDP